MIKNKCICTGNDNTPIEQQNIDNVLQDGLAKRSSFYDARLFAKFTWQKYAVNTCCIEVKKISTNMFLSAELVYTELGHSNLRHFVN